MRSAGNRCLWRALHPEEETHLDPDEAVPKPDTHRVEGFSDGVFAIVITLLVIDLKIPRENSGHPNALIGALPDLWPVALAYVISFVNVYILWVAHHEMMRI